MLQHFLTQILQHATTHVNHIPEIMEIIYHPMLVLIDKFNTCWGIDFIIKDLEGNDCTLLIAIKPNVVNLKIFEGYVTLLLTHHGPTVYFKE